MTTAPLSLLLSRETRISLTGAISIDAGDDDGALGRLREHHKEADGHHSSSEALGNVAAAEPGITNIVGHGEPGVIITGGGRGRGGGATFIAFDNPDDWKAHAEAARGQGIASLLLCACDTGADESGAQLVFDLAHRVNAEVMAPTGQLFIGIGQDPVLERDAVLQRATPSLTERPPAIGTPRPRRPSPMPGFITLRTGAQLVHVPNDVVTAVRYVPTRRGGFGRLQASEWRGSDGSAALRFMQLDDPWFQTGIPLSIVTGRVTLAFGPVERRFLVHNNRVLQDLEAEDTYYYVDLNDLADWAL